MISSKIAAILAYIGGILLIVAGTTGSLGIIGTVIEYIIENVDGATAEFLSIVLQILNFVADLGGISVIVGGTFIFYERKRIGKIIVRLGAGMGIIGFGLILASAFLHGWAYVVNFLLTVTQSIGWIGLIFALASTIIAR